MNGPYHDFFLLSCDDHAFSDYFQFLRHPDALRLSDDLIWYLYDTLSWIPTINPARDNEPHLGLCLYGPTVIHTDGAKAAKSVFGGWAEIFSGGPETLTLRGLWTVVEGDPADSGHYQELTVDRDELVSRLRRLFDFASQVLDSNGRYFILHLGV